jgi:AraC-like DNA-binding protein
MSWTFVRGHGVVMKKIKPSRSSCASAPEFPEDQRSGEVGSAVALTELLTGALHTGGSFVTLAVPRDVLTALVPDVSTAFGTVDPKENPALRLLVRYLDVVQSEGDLDAPMLARSISNHILDLVALALGAPGEGGELARERGGKAARLRAIMADIVANLGERELSSEAVAARHGISARYVRRLFEAEGTSFSAFVLAERLARAHRMLCDPRQAHLTITRIAHENGFGDISYFNRSFRRRFGGTPSDIREAAKRGGDG